MNAETGEEDDGYARLWYAARIHHAAGTFLQISSATTQKVGGPGAADGLQYRPDHRPPTTDHRPPTTDYRRPAADLSLQTTKGRGRWVARWRDIDGRFTGHGLAAAAEEGWRESNATDMVGGQTNLERDAWSRDRDCRVSRSARRSVASDLKKYEGL
ncbi:MAG: hypothetical protein FE78DRAFT_67108 [Acidomyces sp. 'richmondensis']|nr:MAG: hypothetical protein FE78DRAFT_67108 [Acidomyces sp. 'richmondensis']